MNKLKSDFWSFFNDVRGHKDIGELREIVISLIFLKYANDKTISDTLSKISIPKNSKWIYLIDRVEDPKFLELLNDAFISLENRNLQLKNTFSDFDFLNKFKNDSDLLLVNNLFLKISKFNLPNDLSFSNFIDLLLSKFADYEGINVTSFTTPETVSKLMIQLLKPKNGLILDSTCGSGGFFQKIEEIYPQKKFKFYGQELNRSMLAIAKLRFAFNHKNSFQFSDPKNTLTTNQFPDLKSDCVIMHPPLHAMNWINNLSFNDPRFHYGLPPKNNANLAWIQHAIHHLKPDGKALVLLAQNSLFSANKAEISIRKKIIEDNFLEAIITLPGGILNYSGVKTCIWVLNKAKVTEDILLLESDSFSQSEINNTVFSESAQKEISQIYNKFLNVENLSRIVNKKELERNDYNLHPSKYIEVLLDGELTNPVHFSELLIPTKVKPGFIDYPVKSLSIKDLSDDIDNFEIFTSKLKKKIGLRNHSLFKGRALLLATLGGRLKPTFIDTLNEEIAIQKNVVIYNVDEEIILIEFLIQELNKEYVSRQFLSFLKGFGVKHIRKKDIQNFIIDVPPSIKQQGEIIKREKKIRFEKLVLESGFQKQLEDFKKEQEADLSSKRHMLNQDVSSLNSIVEYIRGEFISHKKGIQLETVLDDRDDTTMETLLDSLSDTVKVISDQVNLLSNEGDILDKEVFDVKSFLKKLVKRETSKAYSIVEFYDDNQFNTKTLADKKQLRNVFKSVLDNAIRHGFINNSEDYVFKITLKDYDNYIELLFENNGKTLPKGVTKESYSTKSMKAGKTGNTGLGGYHVGVFAKSHGLDWDLINCPEEEFKVGVKINLKKYEEI